MEQQSLEEFRPDGVDGSVCFLCQTAFQYIIQLLDNEDIDSGIVSLIEKVCYALPSSISSQCSAFIDTYGYFLLSKVGDKLDTIFRIK